jgi:hypothetical protein
MPKRKNQNAAASPDSGNGPANNLAQNATVGAQPATAGRHVKDVPERPNSKAQPSSTAAGRLRSPRPAKAPSRSKKRARKRKRSKQPSQREINAALAQFLGDATNADRAALSRAARNARTDSSAARNVRADSSASLAASPLNARPASPASPLSSSAPPAAAIDARLVTSARPPRVRIGEAMRRTGLDEYRVAETFAGVLETLTGKNAAKAGAVQKIVVDVLKECSRHLDPPQSERAAAAATPVIALIHNIPRPDRTPKPQPQQQLNAATASPAASASNAVAPTIDATPPSAPDASPAIDVQSQIKEPS